MLEIFLVEKWFLLMISFIVLNRTIEPGKIFCIFEDWSFTFINKGLSVILSH